MNQRAGTEREVARRHGIVTARPAFRASASDTKHDRGRLDDVLRERERGKLEREIACPQDAALHVESMHKLWSRTPMSAERRG